MTISADFPYESHFAEVHGSKMHYVTEGDGRPILFLHGNPTSSYLWRNVIPYAADHGQAIAVDLIGMGRSDKPDLDYRFVDHARYVDGFIDAMGLTDLVLVIHDWGSGLGFHYAHRHPDNVRGIAFMEALAKTASWDNTNIVEKLLFRRMRHPVKGDRMNIDKNFFIERVLPMMTSRKLTPAERDAYRAPYLEPASRKPVAQWPREIPFDGEGPDDVHEIVSGYWEWLQQSDIPKLMLWAEPGVIIKKKVRQELEAKLPALESVGIGKGKHYVQEDQPDAIGQALSDWLRRLPA